MSWNKNLEYKLLHILRSWKARDLLGSPSLDSVLKNDLLAHPPILPFSSGFASSSCSNDCSFRAFSTFFSLSRNSRNTFLTGPLGVARQHMVSITRRRRRRPTANIPCGTVTMLPIQPCWNVAFTCDDSWNLDQTWFSEQRRQYHSFITHLSRQTPVPLLRLIPISPRAVIGAT